MQALMLRAKIPLVLVAALGCGTSKPPVAGPDGVAVEPVGSEQLRLRFVGPAETPHGEKQERIKTRALAKCKSLGFRSYRFVSVEGGDPDSALVQCTEPTRPTASEPGAGTVRFYCTKTEGVAAERSHCQRTREACVEARAALYRKVRYSECFASDLAWCFSWSPGGELKEQCHHSEDACNNGRYKVLDDNDDAKVSRCEHTR